MKEDIQVLIGRLSGLEAARRAIEAEIADIHRQIATVAGQLAGPTSSKEGPPTPPQDDHSVLGLDTLGRKIRKRKLSPEEKEKRRTLIAAARRKRLESFEKLRSASFVVAPSLQGPAETTGDTATATQIAEERPPKLGKG
jgi:hypothetical protein